VSLFPWGVLAFNEGPNNNEVKILLTQDEYQELKSKNELPEGPIQVVESRELDLPEGSYEIKDPLHSTEYGKKLLKEYGEDLRKEIVIDENRTIIIEIEYKHYKYPNNYQEEVTLIDKLNNYISPSACATAETCSIDGAIDTSKTYYYKAGGIIEAKQKMRVVLDVYKGDDNLNYYHHPQSFEGSWWRATTKYEFKDGYFAIGVVGIECPNSNIDEDLKSKSFDPEYKDSYNTHTYVWGHSTYGSWNPYRQSDTNSAKDIIEMNLYRGTSYLDRMNTAYTDFN
jgi:hypothetical protein